MKIHNTIPSKVLIFACLIATLSSYEYRQVLEGSHSLYEREVASDQVDGFISNSPEFTIAGWFRETINEDGKLGCFKLWHIQGIQSNSSFNHSDVCVTRFFQGYRAHNHTSDDFYNSIDTHHDVAEGEFSYHRRWFYIISTIDLRNGVRKDAVVSQHEYKNSPGVQDHQVTMSSQFLSEDHSIFLGGGFIDLEDNVKKRLPIYLADVIIINEFLDINSMKFLGMSKTELIGIIDFSNSPQSITTRLNSTEIEFLSGSELGVSNAEFLSDNIMTLEGKSALGIVYNHQFHDGFTIKFYFKQESTSQSTLFSINEKNNGDTKSFMTVKLNPKKILSTIEVYQYGTDQPIIQGYYAQDHWTTFAFTVSRSEVLNKVHIIMAIGGGYRTDERGGIYPEKVYDMVLNQEKENADKFFLLGGAYEDSKLNPNIGDDQKLHFKKVSIAKGGYPLSMQHSENCAVIAGIALELDQSLCLFCHSGFHLQDNNCVSECDEGRQEDPDFGFCQSCAGGTLYEDGVCTYCSDGSRNRIEDCDDGNDADGDGCNSSCSIEPEYVCMQQEGGDICSHDPRPRAPRLTEGWKQMIIEFADTFHFDGVNENSDLCPQVFEDSADFGIGAKCIVEDNELLVIFGEGTSIIVGSEVKIKSGVIYHFVDYPLVENEYRIMTVEGPDYQTIIELQGQKSSHRCEPLQFFTHFEGSDLLRSHSMEWTVTSNPSTDTSQIKQAILDSDSQKSISISNTLLQNGLDYTFQLEFTNFLNDQVTVQKTVTRAEYPNVRLVTPENAYHYSGEAIEIEVLQSPLDCDNIVISWAQDDGDDHKIDINDMISQDNSLLTIPTFATKTETSYHFLITTFYQSEPDTTSRVIDAYLHIKPSRVSSNIKYLPGKFPAFRSFELVGGNSANLDILNSDTDFSYTWSCIDSELTPCQDARGEAIGNPTSDTLSFEQLQLSIFDYYKFSLSVDAGVGVNDVATLPVSFTVEDLGCTIELLDYRQSQKIDPLRDLSVKAMAYVPDYITNIQYEWTITGSFNYQGHSPLRFQEIKIYGGSMQYSTTYNISLELISNDLAIPFQVFREFTTIDLPTTGTLEIFPTEGIAGVTDFTMLAKNWNTGTDSLRYTYGYYLSEKHIGDDEHQYFIEYETFSTEILAKLPGSDSQLETIYVFVRRIDADDNYVDSAPVAVKVSSSSIETIEDIESIKAALIDGQSFVSIAQRIHRYEILSHSIRQQIEFEDKASQDFVNALVKEIVEVFTELALDKREMSEIINILEDMTGFNIIMEEDTLSSLYQFTKDLAMGTIDLDRKELVKILNFIALALEDNKTQMINDLPGMVAELAYNCLSDNAPGETKLIINTDSFTFTSQVVSSDFIQQLEMEMLDPTNLDSEQNFIVRFPSKRILANSVITPNGYQNLSLVTQPKYRIDSLKWNFNPFENQAPEDFLDSNVYSLQIRDHESNSEMSVKNLKQNILMKIPVTQFTASDAPEDNNCVYWNSTELRWATEGCEFDGYEYNKNKVSARCVCSHLTDFAVYSGYQPIQESDSSDPFLFDFNGFTLSKVKILYLMIVALSTYLVLSFWGYEKDQVEKGILKKMQKRSRGSSSGSDDSTENKQEGKSTVFGTPERIPQRKRSKSPEPILVHQTQNESPEEEKKDDEFDLESPPPALQKKSKSDPYGGGIVGKKLFGGASPEIKGMKFQESTKPNIIIEEEEHDQENADKPVITDLDINPLNMASLAKGLGPTEESSNISSSLTKIRRPRKSKLSVILKDEDMYNETRQRSKTTASGIMARPKLDDPHPIFKLELQKFESQSQLKAEDLAGDGNKDEEKSIQKPRKRAISRKFSKNPSKNLLQPSTWGDTSVDQNVSQASINPFLGEDKPEGSNMLGMNSQVIDQKSTEQNMQTQIEDSKPIDTEYQMLNPDHSAPRKRQSVQSQEESPQKSLLDLQDESQQQLDSLVDFAKKNLTLKEKLIHSFKYGHNVLSIFFLFDEEITRSQRFTIYFARLYCVWVLTTIFYVLMGERPELVIIMAGLGYLIFTPVCYLFEYLLRQEVLRKKLRLRIISYQKDSKKKSILSKLWTGRVLLTSLGIISALYTLAVCSHLSEGMNSLLFITFLTQIAQDFMIHQPIKIFAHYLLVKASIKGMSDETKGKLGFFRTVICNKLLIDVFSR